MMLTQMILAQNHREVPTLPNRNGRLHHRNNHQQDEGH